ncbi:glutamate-5-semialdehyde dehydrogenase [Denitrobacterium detoxificans]|jgi:glutamate-5-semialdehyde dehydrogenase|uniref:glutamate-5-semialdehyde dehydrogenase n=1 Tax=Denitrobacterium detoxificans TaxID=79604 RepID=UPI0026ED44E9|nr:glutamate-5-semialdehyde dehydrogenase [Denitrobacterium detoxificans]MBE6465958.1 glutamate-5-semialdehyde dehydrogenase [Denitrobacterium detoxificans]
MSVKEVALAAKKASVACGKASLSVRNGALHAMAQALREHVADIVQANELDMQAAREAGTAEPLLDRLQLTAERIEGMACGLESLAELPDPLGQVQQERTLASGVNLTRVSVSMGVVAMVYEARPNVTADAAGICVKTGNACVLRGGSIAFNSNVYLAHLLHDAAVSAGMPINCICAVETKDRAATDELLQMRGIVDVLIPRGGAGLIRHCVQNATVPVIETGVGNCHVYVHEPANVEMARDIVVNAKTQRPGVCNAIESLLVDDSIAEQVLPVILPELASRDVVIHADEHAYAIAQQLIEQGVSMQLVPATEEDWATEYLNLDIAVRCMSGLDAAIEHVNRFGTRHSECIVTEDEAAAEEFLASIDAAAVYWNASTRFTDGGEFGLGAEIGISTQKLHTRGPFALAALTTYKYLLRGSGQVRS